MTTRRDECKKKNCVGEARREDIVKNQERWEAEKNKKNLIGSVFDIGKLCDREAAKQQAKEERMKAF